MKVKSSTQKEYSVRINRVLDYINKNLSEELTLEKLSDVSCFSPFHFHRIFTAFLNEKPAEYITRLRLEKAAVLLTTYAEMPVTEISFRCGFSSSSTFARAFKQYFGYSSTQWRNGGYEKFKISKNRKTHSKISEADSSPGIYFSDKEKQSQNKGEEIMYGEIKDMPAMHIAYVAHLEGYNDKISIAYEKLCRWAGARGLLNPTTKYIGISLDDPEITPEEKCRFYASITVPEEIKEQGDIQVMDLPAGKYAVVRFDGPAEGISQAYKYIYGEYIPENGYQPEDSWSYEIYYNDPGRDKKFVMDIFVPIKLI